LCRPLAIVLKWQLALALRHAVLAEGFDERWRKTDHPWRMRLTSVAAWHSLTGMIYFLR
jgi:hypothetical protein